MATWRDRLAHIHPRARATGRKAAVVMRERAFFFAISVGLTACTVGDGSVDEPPPSVAEASSAAADPTFIRRLAAAIGPDLHLAGTPYAANVRWVWMSTL